MTLSRLAIVLRARWRLVLIVWLTVVAIIATVSLLLPAKYTATAAVLVDGRQVDPVTGVSQQVGVAPNAGYMATQVDVATSERVVLRALRALKLNERPELRALWSDETEGRGQFEPWLVEKLLRYYDVRPSRDSTALTLAYTAPDAEFAALMSNALMQAYIEATLDLRVEPAKSYNNFFDQRAKQLRDALEQAQTKLSAYQRSKGLIASSDERFDVENARLSELSSQVTVLQSAADGAIGRQGQASLTPDRMQEVLTNPVVANLSTDVSRSQARLQELNSNLGDQHPQVIEAKNSLAELRMRLAEATRRASGSVEVTSTVTRSQLLQAQDALARQRLRVLQLKAQRDEAAVLQRDVEAAQRSYDLVLARAAQTDMESQSRQTNVSVLKSASPPAFPSSPKLALNCAIGIIVGLMLAVAAAVVRETADRRFRDDEDIQMSMGLHILAVVPFSPQADQRADNRLSLLKTRVLSGNA